MIHVFPLADRYEHSTKDTLCDCQPDVDWQSAPTPVVVHKPYDGRRQLEVLITESHVQLKVPTEYQGDCGVWEIKEEIENEQKDDDDAENYHIID